jgi:hypothetical protein
MRIRQNKKNNSKTDGNRNISGNTSSSGKLGDSGDKRRDAKALSIAAQMEELGVAKAPRGISTDVRLPWETKPVDPSEEIAKQLLSQKKKQ